MAKYIPTQSSKCGNELCLLQSALKKGETKSVVKGQCFLCGTEYEYVLCLNPRRN